MRWTYASLIMPTTLFDCYCDRTACCETYCSMDLSPPTGHLRRAKIQDNSRSVMLLWCRLRTWRRSLATNPVVTNQAFLGLLATVLGVVSTSKVQRHWMHVLHAILQEYHGKHPTFKLSKHPSPFLLMSFPSVCQSTYLQQILLLANSSNET